MRVSQIITDYVRRSILTAQGQMIARGAALPEAVAQGALNYYLKAKGAGANPIFEALHLFNTGVDINYITFADTDPHVIDIGFRPSVVIAIACGLTAADAMCVGFDNDSADRGCLYHTAVADEWVSIEGTSFLVKFDSTHLIGGTIHSFSDTGYTIQATTIVGDWPATMFTLALP